MPFTQTKNACFTGSNAEVYKCTGRLFQEDELGSCLHFVSACSKSVSRLDKGRDVNKDLTPKDQDKAKDLTPKDQDKDLTPKDQDKDKDLLDLTPQGPGQGQGLEICP